MAASRYRLREIELDPHFFVPVGVVDVRQENKVDVANLYDAPGEMAVGPILDAPTSQIPNAPSGYKIVSQTVRIGADGRTVVDVLLEFPDIGVYDIDVGLTPV